MPTQALAIETTTANRGICWQSGQWLSIFDFQLNLPSEIRDKFTLPS